MAPGSCKAWQRAQRAQTDRQCGGSHGEVLLALGPPSPPATCTGQAVPGRPQAPEAPPSCSRGWELEPTRPAQPGEEIKNPSCQRVLPDHSFGPAPWCSRSAIWLSLLQPSPRRLPPAFREGPFAVKTQVWGSSMWGVLGRLPSRVPGWPLLAPARVRPRFPCRVMPGAGRSPSRISAQGSRTLQPSWGPPNATFGHQSAASTVGTPLHGLTASTDASLAHILPILF